MKRNLLNDAITEKDGVSFCPLRVAFLVGLALYFGFTIRDMLHADDFVFMVYAKDWLSGLAEYIGLAGAAIAGKNYTEEA